MVQAAVGCLQSIAYRVLVFVGKMCHHIADLMNLTALDQRGTSGHGLDRCTQTFAAVQHADTSKSMPRCVRSVSSSFTTIVFSAEI